MSPCGTIKDSNTCLIIFAAFTQKAFKVMIYPIAFTIMVIIPTVAMSKGIPVKSELLQELCGGCHTQDDAGNLSRISFIRKTPEGWEETLWRHKRIHDLDINVDQKDKIIKYLGDNHCLAPGEIEDFVYSLEKREFPETVENQNVIDTCVRCHSFSKSALQRRTREEWRKNVNMHDGLLFMWLYACQDIIDWDDSVKKAIAYLAKTFPLETKEWKRWNGTRPLIQEGDWALVGYQPGKGDYGGRAKITRIGDGTFKTEITMEFIDGERIVSKGQSTVYAGFSWRGNAILSDGSKVREVYHLLGGGKALKGRWFKADHYEVGGDITLYPQRQEKEVLAVIPRAVKVGTNDVVIKIVGNNLPKITLKELKIGEGIKVKSIKEADSNFITLIADVKPDTNIGLQDIKVGNVVGKRLLAVFKNVDYIKVSPSKGIARLGGMGKANKQYQQFDAFGYSNGPDGLRGTKDDLHMGRVKAHWEIQELRNSMDDQDSAFVGKVDENGLFIPSDEAPNTQRPMSDNNKGDIWVVASYTLPETNKLLKARGYLLVTIPLYVDRPIR